MQAVFLIAAGCTAAVVLQSFWRPKAIFSEQQVVKPVQGMHSILLLLRDRNLRPILLVIVLWSFSPGWHTPLLFYLTDDVRISTAAYGICQAMDSLVASREAEPAGI